MRLITRLKSLLGLGEERSQKRQRDAGVTIEREPTETTEQPDATNERAVKQTDESPEEDTSVSTENLVDEDKPTKHIEEAESDTAAEPAEATGPGSEASQPAQTEATEPEPSPDGIEEATAESELEETEDEEPATEAESETEEELAVERESEPETESPSDDESADAAKDERPLEDVKGIGPAYAERIRNAGIENSAELAVADPEELADETDLSPKRIEGWIERAKSM
ncbi:helix-hairpin-helix domain-containing protein [Haladaptatus sp. NG-WS-4]